MESALKDYLAKHHIHYEIYEHPAVFTVAESDKVTQHIPGARSKNLFLYDEERRYYLICMLGEKRLDMKKLKNHLQVKELHFASPEELKTELYLSPGSVSPLGMIHAKHTRLLIDKEIWDAKQAGFHPNVNTATLVLDHTDIEKFCNSLFCPWEVIDLA